ncbi:hypothetical protein ACQFCJ_004668, partial [Enterobacter hormaechei]
AARELVRRILHNAQLIRHYGRCGELEPRKVVSPPNPDVKQTDKDPLTDDDDSANQNRDANRTAQ